VVNRDVTQRNGREICKSCTKISPHPEGQPIACEELEYELANLLTATVLERVKKRPYRDRAMLDYNERLEARRSSISGECQCDLQWPAVQFAVQTVFFVFSEIVEGRLGP